MKQCSTQTLDNVRSERSERSERLEKSETETEGQTDRGIKGRLHSENVPTTTPQHPQYKAISAPRVVIGIRAELSNQGF